MFPADSRLSRGAAGAPRHQAARLGAVSRCRLPAPRAVTQRLRVDRSGLWPSHLHHLRLGSGFCARSFSRGCFCGSGGAPWMGNTPPRRPARPLRASTLGSPRGCSRLRVRATHAAGGHRFCICRDCLSSKATCYTGSLWLLRVCLAQQCSSPNSCVSFKTLRAGSYFRTVVRAICLSGLHHGWMQRG